MSRAPRPGGAASMSEAGNWVRAQEQAAVDANLAEIRAELQRLREARDRYAMGAQWQLEGLEAMEARAVAAENRVAALEGALTRWKQHDPTCRWVVQGDQSYYHVGLPCTCGLDDAKALLRPAPEAP